MTALLDSTPLSQKLEYLQLLEAKQRFIKRNRLRAYRPYPKQTEFHAAGAVYRERLLMAANQVGKTLAGAAEVAIHLTGRYPSDWTGRRFKNATRWAAGSESGELTRKGVQRLLVGPPEDEGQWGTGYIPGDAIVSAKRKQGVADAIDTVVVKHECGDNSVITFPSYDQGRTKWQADTLDGVWFDEEPPEDVYFEGITRTNATGGIVMVTFTPLKGMSSVVKRYVLDKHSGTHVIQMTIDDAEHYSVEQRASIIASYPEHEREARTQGIPSLGSGRVFPVADSVISVEPFEIPKHWVHIGGLDFGWDHPSAAVKIVWDRDADCIYVVQAHRQREATPAVFSSTVRLWGAWLPWAWPHDGLQHDKGSGEQLASQYRAQGLRLTMERATFEMDGGNGLEAGVMEMLERMQSGRLKVFKTLPEWFEEFRLYHRKEGLIVKEGDDLLSATRYAMMMRRFAVANGNEWNTKIPTKRLHVA